jgi:hypothetical protein
MQVGPDGSVALQTREVQRLETFRVDGKEYQLAHVEPGKHKTLTDRIERLTALGVFWQGTEVGGLVLESPEGERFIQVKTPGEKDSYINVRLASDKVLAKPIEELTVISGPCLFSVQGVVAVLEDGSRVALTDPKSEITAAVEDLIIDERLSMYEAEASIRLGTFIAGYVGGSSLKSVSIHAQVPREEYYLYAIDAYNSGLMSQEIFSRWLDAVDARWATVRGALLGEVAHHNPSLSSEPETPLGRINSLIRSKVSANQAVLLPEAVAILREEDQLWKMILEVENPTSFRELNYLGYVHSVLRAGDARANEARVGISLENPVEERIMRRAEEIAKKLSKVYGFELRLVGIYPQQQIGVEGTDETHLYFAARAATDGQVAQLRQLYIGGNPEAV